MSGWPVRENFTIVDVPPLSLGDEQFVRFDHVIAVERKPGYVLWVFVPPLCFIVLMAWTVFWLDPASPAPQIGIAVFGESAAAARFLFVGLIVLGIVGLKLVSP